MSLPWFWTAVEGSDSVTSPPEQESMEALELARRYAARHDITYTVEWKLSRALLAMQEKLAAAMSETSYTETEALLLAFEDVDADSGNHEPLDEYLDREFLPAELRRLAWACDVLGERARAVRHRKEAQ